jgi:hypothetical protein
MLLPLLLLLCACAPAPAAPPPALVGARRRAAPRAARAAAAPAALPPPPPPPPPPPASAAPPPPALRFNLSSPASWTTGVAILNDSASLLLSFGNWYAPPYAFFTAAAPLATGVASAPTAAVPGSVVAARGAAVAAGFAGQDFSTLEGVFAALDGRGAAWESRAPGVEGTWWEVGAPIRLSLNGSIAAFARTAMDHYDPLGAKHAEVAALDTTVFPPRALLSDAFANGTGVEDVLLSDDGATLVAIAAVDPAGAINSSEVRVYSIGAAGGARVGAFVTGYVFASCLSADGRWLVLATCDSENAVEVYRLDGPGGVVQTANSSYPALPGSFTFAAVCAVSNRGSAWIVWPLWWGSAINATAVGFYGALPSAPTPPGSFLAPTALWTSPPIAPDLQDDVIAGAYLEPAAGAPGAFAFTSWGGAPLVPGAPTPPTLRVFSDAAPGAPLAEIATPSADGTCSGSLEALDVARDAGGDLVVVAAGLDGHANVGSAGGRLYSWSVPMS